MRMLVQYLAATCDGCGAEYEHDGDDKVLTMPVVLPLDGKPREIDLDAACRNDLPHWTVEKLTERARLVPTEKQRQQKQRQQKQASAPKARKRRKTKQIKHNTEHIRKFYERFLEDGQYYCPECEFTSLATGGLGTHYARVHGGRIHDDYPLEDSDG